MMFYFQTALMINCFTSNSSVILSKQTKQATFVVQVLTDETQDMMLCQQLDGSVYTAKVVLGAYTFVYPTQLTYSAKSNLTIIFPCTDNIHYCADAFLATAASFQLFFPSANAYVEDSVSEMKIDSYNRLSCITSPLISVDQNLNQIKVFGTDKGCVAPIDQTKNAILTLNAAPDFVLTKTISLSGITTIQQIFNDIVFDCEHDYIKTPQRTCKRLVTELINNISSYGSITVTLPGIIPDNTTNTYIRQSGYSVYSEISTISSSFVEQFDCFNSQEMIFFTDMIRLTLPTNNSMVNCLKPMKDFIGDFDSSTYVLQVQENVDFRIGTVVSFSFNDLIPDFQANKPWLPCSLEAEGIQKCKEKLKIVSTLPTRTVFIARNYYKNGMCISSFQTEATSRFARAINGAANITVMGGGIAFSCLLCEQLYIKIFCHFQCG
ncbi:Conserved_hypothetical protein [Hexamita inflata]|uniref:Uncharacterized protein n=1 Tax=Hexamita inflata TaxID=28002 RepID=A0ABP1HGU7_9EUKA